MGIYSLVTKKELLVSGEQEETSNFDKLINNVQGGILEVFKSLTPNLQANKTLWKTLRAINNEFITRNDDHVRFMGSNLLGCYILKFTTSGDRASWFTRVMGVSENDIRQALVEKGYIYPAWKVNCDVFSLSVTYVIHLLLNGKTLNEKQKDESILNAFSQMYYRYIGSWMSTHFQYPCSYEAALTTYNSLSKRYDIKIYGNWGKLIAGKVKQATSPNSIHYKTFMEYKDPANIFYINRDTSNRIRASLDWIYDRHVSLANSSAGRVVTSEDSIEIGSDVILRDNIKMYDIYYNYLINIVNTNSFVKTELVDVILEIMNKARRDYFLTTLNYIQLNYGKKGFSDIDEFVQLDLQYAFDIIHYNQLTFSNIRDVIAKLRSRFMAPKGSDEELLELRINGEALVDRAVGVSKFSSYSPSAERTSLMIYLVVRALCMKHYS